MLTYIVRTNGVNVQMDGLGNALSPSDQRFSENYEVGRFIPQYKMQIKQYVE